MDGYFAAMFSNTNGVLDVLYEPLETFNTEAYCTLLYFQYIFKEQYEDIYSKREIAIAM